MPLIVYIFTLSAFALGLAEFVPIGLTDVMAQSLGVNVEQVGTSVTLYALGATFAAPVLSALTAGWTRKRTMLVTVLVFTLGSLLAALAITLSMHLVARFVAGMGHGLFLAVASSTAARLVGPKKAGSAVAVVFGGFTIAMAIGVPLSTYLGGVISWRPVLGAIAVFGALGFLGLLLGMKEPLKSADHEGSESVSKALKALFHPVLLSAALVTVLGYAGSFTAYTYIAPLLTEVTHVSGATVSIFMLIYGVLAAIGNVMGGKMTDRLGVNRASVVLIQWYRSDRTGHVGLRLLGSGHGHPGRSAGHVHLRRRASLAGTSDRRRRTACPACPWRGLWPEHRRFQLWYRIGLGSWRLDHHHGRHFLHGYWRRHHLCAGPGSPADADVA